ncbi:DUF4240 domain-containing protein [Kribbella sp. NPDC026611]|uniref:DUF4240 domain-containing protein n=1 Tax=Kribbella sp. NPDC026611 TaxID=3154911 RepID=UPI0033E8515A
MDENEFWQLIEECRPEGADEEGEELAQALVDRLSRGPVELVTGFAEQLSRLLYQLDREEYGKEMSGDAFLYTRAAVVAAGRKVYESVLRDRVAFTPYAEDDVWAESLLTVPDEAFRELTGEEWDRGTEYSYESFSNADGWPHLNG